MEIEWTNINRLESKEYICGHCGHTVASNTGYFSGRPLEGAHVQIYICPHCAKPTIFHKTTRVPDTAPGNDVAHVPDDVAALYNESRRCVANSCYTASVLACRKLLMNIAVTEGADESLRFVEYIDFLANNGYVPPKGRGWVDHIRRKGNEATHEIPAMSRDDAVELVSFAEMLLKFIYEFPAKIPST